MGKTLDGCQNLFLQLGVQNDPTTQRVLSEIGLAFAGDRFSTEKTPEEWMRWLVVSIRTNWKLAEQEGTPKDEFITDFVAEMSQMFSGAKTSFPITEESLTMAVEAIVNRPSSHHSS